MGLGVYKYMLDKLEKEYALPIVQHFSHVGKALVSLLVGKYGDCMSRSCLLGVIDNSLTVDEFDIEIFGKLSYFLSYIRFYNDAGSWKFAIFFNKKLLTISAKSFLTLVLGVEKRLKDVEILKGYEDTQFVHMSILTGKSRKITNQDVYMTTYMLFRKFFDKEFDRVELFHCTLKGRGVYKIDGDVFDDLDLLKYCAANEHIIFDIDSIEYLDTVLHFSNNKCVGFRLANSDISSEIDLIVEHVDKDRLGRIFVCLDGIIDPVQKLRNKEYARRNGVKWISDYSTYKSKLNYYAYKKD